MRRSIAQNKVFLIIYTVIAIAAYAAIALLIMYLVAHSGLFPSGPDTMYHVYRGELVYQEIAKGNWYPLYDPNWYNGVEIMRYWPPMCPYFYALCMFIANLFITHSYGGFIVFCGMIFFLGAIVWHIIGIINGRPFLGTIIAILWFFTPNNIYALFGEGNLARSVSMIFLPLFIFAAYKYLESGRVRYLPVITISFMLIAFCHLGYAGMVALSLILYLVIDMITYKRGLRNGRVLVSTLFGFLLTALYSIPSLVGGVSGGFTTENARMFFQSLSITINPLYRIDSSIYSFYFGLAAAILALLGAFFSYKKSRPGFWVGLITLILTADFMCDFIMILPGSSLLWMLRFISIALCFIFMSFIEWKTLRKPIMVVMLLLLIVDTVPSLYFVYGDKSGVEGADKLRMFKEDKLLDRAKMITKQRFCLFDDSELTSTGAYVTTTGDDAVKTTFGAGWTAAETGKNILNMNKGMDFQGYLYSFDRALELGNDTVMVYLVGDMNKHIQEMDDSARRVGYTLDKEQGPFRLYRLEKPHPDQWGLITEYKAISIGNGADIMTRLFPYMKDGASNLLDDYTFEELKKYELVYLASFEFRNREYAENLLVDLSEAGTKVVISADGVPDDRAVNGRVFLDVLCNDISFSQGFPLLDTIDGTLDTDLFPSELREWKTCFCDGLDKVWGKVKDENYDISFLGTKKNDNIIFVGLNLAYYYGQTRDSSVEKLLSRVMSLSTTDLPKREIVPIEIQYETNKITINSDYDNVNTTLAYHNIFGLDKKKYEDNHLLYVPKGVTEIYMEYPYFVQGIICTVVSGLLALIYHVVIHIMNRRRRKRAALGLDEAGVVYVAEPEEDEVVKDSYERLTEEEFERANAAYSFFNEKPIAEDTEVEDYGTDLEFEEVDIESYDYDMDYNNTEDDEDDDYDDYNIKE